MITIDDVMNEIQVRRKHLDEKADGEPNALARVGYKQEANALGDLLLWMLQRRAEQEGKRA